MKGYFNQELKEDEKLIVVLRKHSLSLVKPILIFSVIFIVLCFLIPVLFSSFIGLLIFILVLTVIVTYLIHEWFIWYFDIFIITDQRIIDIDQRGLFNRTVSETTYEKVQDVTYEMKGPLETFLEVGTVKVQTAGAKPVLEMNYTKHPQTVQELIMELGKGRKKKAQEVQKELTAKELVEFIAKVKKEDDR